MSLRCRSIAATLALVFALVVLLGAACQALAVTAPGSLLWTKVYGPSPLADVFFAAARCPDGSVVTVGVAAAGVPDSSDALICKYAASGALQWAKTYDNGESMDDIFSHVAVDRAGNIYAAGSSRSSATGDDYLVVKYDKRGAQRWARAFDGGHAMSDGIGGLALDSAGNPWVTGSVGLAGTGSALGTYKLRAFDGDILRKDRWTGPSGTTWVNGWGIARGPGDVMYATGSADNAASLEQVIVVKYKATGRRSWTRSYLPSGATDAWGADVAVGPDGTPSVLVTVELLSGGIDTGLLRYSATGARRTLTRYTFAVDGKNWAGDLAIDAKGNIFTCGRAVPASGATAQGYLIKWSPTGKRRWTRLYPATPGDTVDYRTVLPDQAGGAYVAGSVKFAAPAGTNGLVRHVSGTGRTLWSQVSMHPGGNDTFNALAFCGRGGVCAAGRYQSTPGDDDAVLEKRQK